MADQGFGAPGGTEASGPNRPDDEIHDDDELAEALAAQLERLSATGAIPVQRPAARAKPAASAPRFPAGSQRIPTVALEADAASVTGGAPSSPRSSSMASAPAVPPTAAPEPVAPADNAAPPAVPQFRPRSRFERLETDAPGPQTGAPRSRHAAAGFDPSAPQVTRVPDEGPAPRSDQPSVADAVAAAWERSLRSFAVPPAAVPPVASDPASSSDAPTTTPRSEVPRTTGQHAAIRPRGRSPYSRPAESTVDRQPTRADAADPEDERADEFAQGRRPAAAVSRVATGGIPVATGQVPLADADDDDGIDDRMPSGFESLPANTAAVGVLPPLYQGGLPVTGPTPIPAEPDGPPLDRSAAPRGSSGIRPAIVIPVGAAPVLADVDAVESAGPAEPAQAREPAGRSVGPDARRLGAGFVPSFVVWGGAFASPLALVLGFVIAATSGGSPTAIVAMVVAVAVALPGIGRVALVGAHRGLGSIGVTRLAFGRAGGVLPGILLLASRLTGAVVVLLCLSQLATSFASRTGVAGALPDSIPAIVAVVAAGLLALLATVWRPRVVGFVLVALGIVGTIVTIAAVVLIAPDAGAGAVHTGRPAAQAATAVFVLLGLLAAGSAADVARRPLVLARPSSTAIGTVAGVAFGLVVVCVGVTVGVGSGISIVPADALVGGLIDATPAALVIPIAVALLLASVGLVAILVRSAGSAAGDLLGPGRSSALGSTAAALVAIAGALAVLAGGLDIGSVLAVDGPVVAVPAAAWLGIVTTAKLRSTAGDPPVLWTQLVGFCVAVVVGLLFVDQLVVASERSPLLAAMGVSDDSVLHTPMLAGLLAAFVLGLATGGVARLMPVVSAPAEPRASGPGRPLRSVE